MLNPKENEWQHMWPYYKKMVIAICGNPTQVIASEAKPSGKTKKRFQHLPLSLQGVLFLGSSGAAGPCFVGTGPWRRRPEKKSGTKLDIKHSVCSFAFINQIMKANKFQITSDSLCFPIFQNNMNQSVVGLPLTVRLSQTISSMRQTILQGQTCGIRRLWCCFGALEQHYFLKPIMLFKSVRPKTFVSFVLEVKGQGLQLVHSPRVFAGSLRQVVKPINLVFEPPS